ncbi:ABC transporter ATP-binding protein [Flammeovirga yaeyamensis]|uniref:ABC transporter ATP-binding protein n=1 Tax=Flammeovirga yaeyamensis TaxID=367791 RepID=A0AAX1N0J1_9BACT|nr:MULTISPECIES: ABC transporter ATP-binding protein [Flammeovirga]ANQ47754.1 ABC transporter ATP-binding protein [Flammeovirga sp. MY04]MBB3700219.1 ABC-2 type transport system ATP-binding protein [Flammeovirga yaeyamensis]NMF37151.1 ABC transporter ATP-binding protein [Flammeovirga yaeyamensis]QWG00842.1 ABC transporter ATP-binding protein [Flammeovirga yaeyamensis]
MIDINQLTFGYNKRNILYDALDLNLKEGNIYGLLGENGAGKSTLLMLIAGLKKPFSGSINVGGYEADHGSAEFLREIFFIPEEMTFPNVTVSDYISVLAPFYPKFNREHFIEMITEFGLSAEQKMNNMSYGQKKKVLISIGLASNTRLLLMDEPTNGLDIPSKSQFRKLVAKYMTDDRVFLISTHQVRDLESLIDPIVIVDKGKVVFNETLDTISEKLLFTTADKVEASDIIYTENGVAEDKVVAINHTDAPSRINLELLFNAVLTEKAKMNEALPTHQIKN